MKIKLIAFVALLLAITFSYAQKPLTKYVNPFLGTATLWDSIDIGYKPTHRTWGAEVFPGSSLPNAMVQLTPLTQWRSGSGYQYEDTVIYAFIHTSKGHWNLGHIPMLPANGQFSPEDYCSPYNHKNESAQPGFYQVYLERYGVNAELTSTLRCAFHKYTFKNNQDKKLIVDLSRSNERVRGWEINQEGEHVFKGFQQIGEKMYFYAVANHAIKNIASQKSEKHEISVVSFGDSNGPLELKIGFSFVSIANAKENLEKEMHGKSFQQVHDEATQTWENLLSKIKVSGGTERQKGLFYSTLYRSFLWPALRSDCNGQYTDVKGNVVSNGFNYYTEPSLWDDYRNKLVLLGMLSPKVTEDVIKSLIDKGEKSGGFMPTFFHGDHAAPFIAGSYLRGIKGFDIKSAYNLLLRNATMENRSRPRVMEYIEKGYYRHREDLLRRSLPDHIIIQHRTDLMRGCDTVFITGDHGLIRGADDVHAQFHALIADEHGRPCDQLAHLMLTLATKRAIACILGFSACLGHDRVLSWLVLVGRHRSTSRPDSCFIP